MNSLFETSRITTSSRPRTMPQKRENSFTSVREWFPWWQIEFASKVRVEGLSITGLTWEERQPPLLSVLISDDGLSWLPVWTQPLHVLSDPHNIVISFSRIYSARFIRVRADTLGQLSFEQIEPIVRQATDLEEKASDVISCFSTLARNSRVVLSALFNESDEYLGRYIDNFLAYTPETVSLIINFPHDRKIPNACTGNPRVHIFNGRTKREKWGHTLLIGHIEAFEEACSRFPDFRYFATMASNGLLVRQFDVASALMQLQLSSRVPTACERAYELDQEVDPVDPTYHGTWMWHHLRNSTGLGDYIKSEFELDRVSVSQIEGLFARRSDWALVQDRRRAIDGLERFFSFENFMALEELLPTSLFNEFGSGEYTHVCRVLWSGTRQVTLDDLLQMTPRLPAHQCALKWFDRSPAAQPTLAVTTEWGRALMQMANNSGSSLGQFQKTTLTSRLLKEMLAEELFGPITNTWWDSDLLGRNGFRWSVRDLPCERQYVSLDIPNLRPSGAEPAYLFMEATGQLVSIALAMHETETGDTRIRLSCSTTTSTGAPVSGVHLQGYLYLSGLRGSTVFLMTVERDRCSPNEVLSRTVFYDEHGYVVDYADRLERDGNVEKHYFVREARGEDGQVWIGLPVCCNASAEFSLAVGPDFKNSRQELI